MDLSFALIYIQSLAITLIYTTLLFYFAYKKSNNSIIDTGYGLGFIISSTIIFYLSYILDPISIYSIIILSLIIVWGTRLSYRIYTKNKNKPEDFRYATWRELWAKKGAAYFYIRSYLQIFILQGLIISIVLLPLSVALLAKMTVDVNIWIYAGIGIWIVGFLFESIGDYQLDAFIKNPDPTKGSIMKTGLWKYSRHPNYFGESSMWWGLSCIAYGSTGVYFAFISPLLITFLLLFVSGIPMLEKKWKGNSEWEDYKKRTSPFIPLPPH